jgi:isopentenyl-diphosphate delta-isomerase type 1
MAEEYLDILNEQGETTGESHSYDEAHEKGLIHHAVHIWILNSKKELLLQKRASNKRAYPDYWDISAAGHVSAGETSLQGSKRELKEELGIDLSDSAFQYLFTVKENIILNQGTYVNNEFQDVYLVRLDSSQNEIKFDEVEVAGIKWVTIDEFKKWIADEKYMMVPHAEEYSRLVTYLENL